MRVAIIAVGAAVAGACLRTPAYECSRDDQCALATVDGTCEPTADGRHFCAVPDDTCASHERFGDTAADQAGVCAGGPLPKGRGADACLAGARFPADFSSCTAQVCAALPSCCNSSWTSLCVMEADSRCHLPCGRQLAFAALGEVDVVADDDHDGMFTVVASKTNAVEHYANVAWCDLDADATPELAIATADLGDSGDEQWLDHFDGTHIVDGLDLRTVLDSNSDDILRRYSALAISVGDYDHDGWADLAWIGTYPTFHTLHNREHMQFEFGPEGASGPPDLQNPIAGGVGWGDLDGDGKDDLALVMDSNVWVELSGGMTLTPVSNVALPGRPYWGAWGDVDGDGKLDLAVAGDSFARVFQNDGNQLKPNPVWQLNGAQLEGGTWIDMDGDGDLDIAVAEQGGKLYVFENMAGTLSLTPKWTSFEDQEPSAIIAADVDGDHDMDLVIANDPPLPARIYLDNGDGTFELGTLTLPKNGYQSVSATARTPH